MDTDFFEELRTLMKDARIIRRADMYLDSCGRESRTENIVTLPVCLRERFKAFLDKYAYSESVLDDGMEHGMVTSHSCGSRLTLSPRCRDYDGFTEVDIRGVHLDCVECLAITASVYVKGEIPRYDWRTGVVNVPGIQNHPVTDVHGFSACLSMGNPWFGIDHPWGLNDTTYVCFVAKDNSK